MDRTNLTIFTLSQDSVKIDQQSIQLKLPTVDRLKLEIPGSILDIPGIPMRFQDPKPYVKPMEKTFFPSANDSMQFNLGISETQHTNILKNTVAQDFLTKYHRKHQKIDSIAVAARDSSNFQNFVEIQDSIETTTFAIQPQTTYNPYNFKLSQDSASQNHMSSTKQVISNRDINTPDISVNHSKDILTALLILSLAITGAIRLTNYKFVQQIFASVFSGQNARKMIKTDSVRNRNANFALNFLFLFNTSLFIYEFIHFKNIPFIGSENLFAIPVFMAFILVFIVFKMILYHFVGFVFECRQQNKEYMFYSTLTNKIFGLTILPIVLFVPYVEHGAQLLLFYTGLGLFVLMYIIQLIRGFSIILKDVSSLFYLFLYLCALEILPLVILYSMIIKAQ